MDNTIEPGVYQDFNNHSALVFIAKPDAVYYVANLDGTYECHALPPEQFARRYGRHLPAYPVRRCARVYTESPTPKSGNAAKVLGHLLRV